MKDLFTREGRLYYGLPVSAYDPGCPRHLKKLSLLFRIPGFHFLFRYTLQITGEARLASG